MNKIYQLTEGQKKAYRHFRNGHNIFVTGPAGTGKTFLINEFKKHCYSEKKRVGITALTGCAAYIIHGNTLHSWAGVGLGEDIVPNLVKKIKKNRFSSINWKYSKILIIDEISMMSKELFDKLEEIARIIRKNNKMWGGLQVCAFGDMCQLPPCNAKFCFESEKWNDTFAQVVTLNTIKRQNNTEFCDCLNEIRFGKVTQKTKELLERCSKKIYDENNPIKPTRLFAYNNKVDRINKKEHSKIISEKTNFKCKTSVTSNDKTKFRNNINYVSQNMDKNMPYDIDLTLSIGAQVMLIINIDVKRGLTNGSRGVVVGFTSKSETNKPIPIVRFIHGIKEAIDFYQWKREEKDFIITKKQIPLKLAWAISIHKTQGSTLDLAEVDVKNIFEYGQVYVALSRVKSSSSLYIKDYDVKKIKCHPKVLEFYKVK